MKTETQGPALAKAAVPSGLDSTPITPKMSPIKWDGGAVLQFCNFKNDVVLCIVIYVFPDEGELEVAELHLPVKSDIEDNDNETREAGLAAT